MNIAEQSLALEIISIIVSEYPDATVKGLKFEETILYAALKNENNLLCKIRLRGKKPYLAIKSMYLDLLVGSFIGYYQVESEKDFLRIPVSEYFSLEPLGKVFKNIYLDSCSTWEVFGCCSRYLQCSDSLQCIHADVIFAKGCQYKKSLQNGIVFYGKNRTVK